MLFSIASAYEATSHHRTSPPDFGPLAIPRKEPGEARKLPAPRELRKGEIRAVSEDGAHRVAMLTMHFGLSISSFLSLIQGTPEIGNEGRPP